MNIEKIAQAHRYQIFNSFTWPPGLPIFRRYNLLWAPNGSGKTTLSSLFYYLERGESIPTTEGEVRVQLDGRSIDSSQFAKEGRFPIRVFNRDSVERSVMEGIREQLPPVFYIGDVDVEIQKVIEHFQKRAKRMAEAQVTANWQHEANKGDFERFCISSAKSIKDLLTAEGSAYNNYDKSRFKAAAKWISMRPDRSGLGLSAASRRLLIAKKNSTPKRTIGELHNPGTGLWSLRLTIEELLRRSVIADKIDALVANPGIASWVNSGLPLHEGQDRCLFCEQILPANRLQQLKEHFNDAYQAFLEELSRCRDGIASRIHEIATLGFPSSSEFYDDEIESYERKLERAKDTNDQIRSYLRVLLDAIDIKIRKPFDSLEFVEVTGQFNHEYPILSLFGLDCEILQNTLGGAITSDLNAFIAAHNDRVGRHVEEVADARKSLESADVEASLEAYQSKEQLVNESASRIDRLKEIALRLQKKISTLQESIRRHQRPGNELTKELAAYLGHDDLSFHVEDTGYIIRRRDQPAKRLSEGEKTAIAVLYFLKSLYDSSFDREHGIVVIDDPVSSLDASSLYCAFGHLQARTQDVGQLFIFTHNFTLFRLTKNWFGHLHKVNGVAQSSLYMLRTEATSNGRNSQITALDPLLIEFESDYHYLFKSVVLFARNETNVTTGDCYTIANSARRLLEVFMAFRLPQSSSNLDAKLQKVAFDTAKKTRLLRFLHVNSHADHIGEFEHDPSPLLEAREITLDLLEMMRSEDPKHFDGLCERIGYKGYYARG